MNNNCFFTIFSLKLLLQFGWWLKKSRYVSLLATRYIGRRIKTHTLWLHKLLFKISHKSSIYHTTNVFSTFVCPTELIAFSERASDFANIGCQVIGVSTDSEFSHLAWVNTPRKVNLYSWLILELSLRKFTSLNNNCPERKAINLHVIF